MRRGRRPARDAHVGGARHAGALEPAAQDAQALAQRARIVLGCAAGETHTALAGHLRMTKQTVGKWRARFLATRLDGLLDEPRPGAPRTITDAHGGASADADAGNHARMPPTGARARWRRRVV